MFQKKEAEEFLKKQPLWQIYLPKPKYIPRPSFDENIPNRVHQADILFLPHDKGYKYALTIVDLGSRFKEAEPLKTKTSKEIANAFEENYKRSPLVFPKILQVDPGKEFEGYVKRLFEKSNTKIRTGNKNLHRDQAVVERFNRTLAENLFSYQYQQELLNPDKRNQYGLEDYQM